MLKKIVSILKAVHSLRHFHQMKDLLSKKGHDAVLVEK